MAEASFMSAASSTTFQINPHCAASSAESFSPRSASPIARALPARRGRKKVPPESGMRPIFENACTKLAERAARTRSQARAMLAPAPAATPFTAQTMGFGSSRKRRTSGL